MLRIGVLLLVLAAVVAVVGAAARPAARGAVAHSCGLVDQEFLDVYRVQLTAVGMYGSDYLAGDARPGEVIDAADTAAQAVEQTAPADAALQTVRRYAPAMFRAYAAAVRARAAGRGAGREMLAAYSIGARVQDVLREARTGLSAAGCPVTDLL